MVSVCKLNNTLPATTESPEISLGLDTIRRSTCCRGQAVSALAARQSRYKDISGYDTFNRRLLKSSRQQRSSSVHAVSQTTSTVVVGCRVGQNYLTIGITLKGCGLTVAIVDRQIRARMCCSSSICRLLHKTGGLEAPAVVSLTFARCGRHHIGNR